MLSEGSYVDLKQLSVVGEGKERLFMTVCCRVSFIAACHVLQDAFQTRVKFAFISVSSTVIEAEGKYFLCLLDQIVWASVQC